MLRIPYVSGLPDPEPNPLVRGTVRILLSLKNDVNLYIQKVMNKKNLEQKNLVAILVTYENSRIRIRTWIRIRSRIR